MMKLLRCKILHLLAVLCLHLCDPVKLKFKIHMNSELIHIHMSRNRPVHLSDSRCGSLIAETGVLMAITGHGLTPPVGDTKPKGLFYPPPKPRLLIRRLLNYELVVPLVGHIAS
ncbi:hypothetical protein AVEN_264143-1 [Araneus ventricosus]|uniref:Secreted protein n=1 Tax=Araneus ventricosus TaxID=182803 RepID=A0A4Y2H984_ARAVE|nr:hypothetical protein AVEN_264143-1 [Araneus ventricosus]